MADEQKKQADTSPLHGKSVTLDSGEWARVMYALGTTYMSMIERNQPNDADKVHDVARKVAHQLG